MNRILFHFLLIIGCLLVFPVKAQKMYQWEIYPSYHNSQKNVSGKEKVYSVCNNSLISYQPDYQELYLYDKTNLLNEFQISFIKYNEEVKKLVIVYSDGNIDILRNDETVINLPQYKDKNINNKDIYAVNVSGKYALLSTGFGIVLLDLEKEIISNTYSLEKVNDAVIYKNKVYAATASGVYTGDMNQNLLDKKNWRQSSNLVFTEMMVFDNHLYGNNRTEHLYQLSENENQFQKIEEGNFHILNASNNMMIAGSNNKICLFKAGGERITINQSNFFTDLSYLNGTFWGSSDYSGLQPYKLNNQNQLEAAGEAIIPNSPIRNYFNFINYTGDRLLAVGGNLNYNGIDYEGTVMYLDQDKWTNFQDGSAIVSATGVPYINTVNIAQDPRDPNHHFVTSARMGLYEFQNGNLLKHYSYNNSPLVTILPADPNPQYFVSTAGAIYDQDNNLWFINNQVDTIINIIKADGTWTKLYDDKLKKLPTCDFIMFDQKGRIWINSRRNTPGMYMLDYNGSIDATSDDQSIFRGTITNQDGTTYTPDFFYCMTEDKNGEIWVGTNLGLFVISNPDEFMNSDFHYTQIKVPRNDGTNYADYLLNNVSVTAIAVDGANRKWIGSTSGVYLVSADGLETIYHFTTDNSPLISNVINSIAINPNSGKVMIATDKGLVSYNNDASEPEDKLEKSQIIAYPNPVKPEYNGYITIKGLTANSSIKITSSNGQLITSGTSNGGIFTWNGRDKQGKRVASGVYSVMATNEEGNESVVTKIVMIR